MSEQPRNSRPKGRAVWLLTLGLLLPLGFLVFALRGFLHHRKSGEASMNVRTLCRLTLRYHEQNKNVWRSAGPSPKTVPPNGEAVPFDPDDGFKAIGFLPEKVRYQYEVTVQPDIVRCTARGDLDGDGVLSNFSIGVIPDSKELTGLDVQDELE